MSNQPILFLDQANVMHGKTIVLSDVNIDIHSGEFVYLIGRTGSGKTSLLKTLYGELPLKEGKGRVSGFDLKQMRRSKISELRRTIGIVFQDFQLLMDRDIGENIKFVMRATGWKNKEKMNNRMQQLLEMVGMLGKEKAMPHQLSGGEQQRIAIARALINEPDLILADEPTGNLDPVTSDEIMRLLFDISSQGKAILMATHDYLIINKFPTRTIKTSDGTIKDVNLAQAEEFKF